MKKIAGLFLYICLLFSCESSLEENTSSNEIAEQIPQWLDLYNVPGAAIALIEDGEVKLKSGFGYSNLESKKKVDLNTVFNVGSISKTITAWGVMRLVEMGKVDLDEAVEKYLTDYQLPDSEFPSEKVTIRRLLSHTAGISLHGFRGFSLGDDLPSTSDFLRREDRNGDPVIRLISEPGTGWRYSGGGYLILQHLIEEQSGQSFARFMKEQVLEPLGMRDSDFEVSEELLANASSEYSTIGDELTFQVFAAKGAAGFYTTIEDFATFLLINLGLKSQSVLSEKNLQMMHDSADASDDAYGLGYQIETVSNSGIAMIGHAGSNLGWHAFFRFNPQTKDGFAMFTNSGYGWNVYRRAYRTWMQSRTGMDLGADYNTSIMATMIKPLKKEGTKAAINQYKRVFQEDSSSFDRSQTQLLGLARLLSRDEKWSDAREILEFNASQFPNFAETYYQLGEVYLQLENSDLAKTNFQKCLELDSAHSRAREKLSELD